MSNKLKTNVSELLTEIKDDTNRYIKNLIGELKEMKLWNNLHCYAKIIDIHDKDKVIPITIFNYNSYFPEFKKNYKEGDVIVICGKLNFNMKRSEITIIIDDIQKENIKGDFSASKKLNEILAKERGFFDKEKRDIDFTKIKNIAILTSLSGEVVYDIIRHLTKYSGNIFVHNVNVQGSNCVKTNIESLNDINNNKYDDSIDLIVIARGGGSEEDLFEYNNIDLLGAVYKCSIPIITAIGHTQDNPLICRVSDVNCSTPTKVASLFNDKLNVSENVYKTKLNTLNSLFLQSFHDGYSRIQSKEMLASMELNSQQHNTLSNIEIKKNKIFTNLEVKYMKKNLSIMSNNKPVEMKTKEDIVALSGKTVEIKYTGGTFKIQFPKPYDFIEESSGTSDTKNIKKYLDSIDIDTIKTKKFRGYKENFESFLDNQDLNDSDHIKKILHHLSDDIKLLKKINDKINHSSIKNDNNYSIYSKYIDELNTSNLLDLKKMSKHLLYLKDNFDNVSDIDVNDETKTGSSLYELFDSINEELIGECLRKKRLFNLLLEYKAYIMLNLQKYTRENSLNVWGICDSKITSITNKFIDSDKLNETEEYSSDEDEETDSDYNYSD